MARRFSEPDVSRNDRLVNLIAKHVADLVDDLSREVCSLVVHRHQQPFDFEIGIQGAPDTIDRVHQISDSLEGQVLALDGDQHRVGRGQGVDREQAE